MFVNHPALRKRSFSFAARGWRNECNDRSSTGWALVLIDLARQLKSLSVPNAGFRAGTCIGLASLALLVGAGSVHDATAENETRTLSFHHTHSDEDLTVTFKRDGRYDEAALKQLNHFLRDWRSQDETVMDRHLFDILWEVYRDVDGKQPIQIISSYRSPATNAMLRHRSANSGVARFSQHMLGHAMDFYIPGVPLEQIRFAGLRLQRGGVGFYPTSGSPFVHLDTGSIRHWPRMTHDQLAKVFPDGRTVHVPTDGVPLKGYELAKAEIEKRGNGDDAATISKPSFLASLFKGGKSNDEEDEAAAPAEEKPARAPVAVAAAKPAEPAPTPRSKPQVTAALQLASADVQVVQPPKAKPAPASADKVESKSETAKPENPADIINARGFWDDNISPKQDAAAQAFVAVAAARKALEAADPQSTASTSAPYQAHGLCAAGRLPARPFQRRGRLRADPAQPASRTGAQSECGDRDQHHCDQGHAGPGRCDHQCDAAVGRQGQRHLAAHADAGAEHDHLDVGDHDGRFRHDADALVLRQAAGHNRHELLRRSDAGTSHRSLLGLGDHQARDDVVHAAHRAAEVTPNCFRKPGVVLAKARTHNHRT